MSFDGIGKVVLHSFVSTHKMSVTPFVVMRRVWGSAQSCHQPVLPDGNSHEP